MARFCVGDMWQQYEQADLFLITTNSALRRDGALVMGRGIARQARERFPGLDAALGQEIQQRCGSLGVLWPAHQPALAAGAAGRFSSEAPLGSRGGRGPDSQQRDGAGSVDKPSPGQGGLPELSGHWQWRIGAKRRAAPAGTAARQRHHLGVPREPREKAMNQLKAAITALPTLEVGGRRYLSYQAVTDKVAAFFFANGAAPHPTGELDTAAYQRILETADQLCRELGYVEVVKLTPPTVPLTALGLYWAAGPSNPVAAEADEATLIHAGPSPAEMLADGLLLDPQLSRLGLDEVSRQHFKIPVTASEGVIELLHRAVASAWPNDYKGLWHDILGMCIRGGQDVGPNWRKFTVIIRGLERRYWRFQSQVRQDNSGAPYLHISLVEESNQGAKGLFPLGQVVMTPGVAALGIDPTPYIARHAAGDWGELDTFDQRQNDIALKEGLRIFSAYDVAAGDDETVRLWVITEADRSVTTALLPREY